MSVHYMTAVTYGAQRPFSLLALELQGIVSHQRWVLGSNSGPLGEQQML